MSGLRFFPIAYDVSGQTVILAGGGEPALNKLRLLLRSKAVIRVIAPELEPDIAALVEAHGLEHVPREPPPATSSARCCCSPAPATKRLTPATPAWRASPACR